MEARREARIAHARRRTAEGEADLGAGRCIEGDEVLEWLRAWAAGERLPGDDEVHREVRGRG